MMNSWGAKNKLAALVIGASLIAALIGIIGIINMKKGVSIIEEVTEINIPNLLYVAEINADYTNVIRRMNYAFVFKTDPEKYQEQLRKVDSFIESMNKTIKNYEAFPFSPGEEVKWKATKAKIDDLKAIISKILSESDLDKRLIIWTAPEQSELRSKIDDLFKNLLDHHRDLSKAATNEKNQIKSVGLTSVILIVIAGVIFLLITGTLLVRSIVSKLEILPLIITTTAALW